MFLKTKVKADCINNLTDARYFAAAGVEWLGFRISEDMPIEDVQVIIDWVDGVKVVLEIPAQISQADYLAIETLHPDFIQVDINCELEELHEPIPIIRVIDPSNLAENVLMEMLEDHISEVDGFVLDLSAYSWADIEQGKPISVATLQHITQGYPCLLKLNYTSKDIDIVTDTLKLEGVCLEGGDEDKVGYKSFESLDDLLETLSLD